MSKGPIEFKPRSVTPIKTGDLERRELFEEVGRAIVSLSDIENWLVNIAYIVSLTETPGMEVPNMFYAILGFEKRLQFADLIVELEATDDAKARWKKITSALHEHRGIRNLVAHYGMGTGLRTDEHGRTDVFLQPPEFKDHSLRPAKVLRVKEVRASASALGKISTELEKLWWDIDNSFLPKHLRDDDEMDD
jgi:hypothetical protein